MTLLQRYLEIDRLTEFIDELIGILNDESKDEAMWEYYLHKVHDKSFKQFMQEVDGEEETADMDEIEATVKQSEELLTQFNGINIEL